MKQRAILLAISSLGVAIGAVTVTVLLSLPALLPGPEAPGSVAGVTLGPSSGADRPRAEQGKESASPSEKRRPAREVRRRHARRTGAAPAASKPRTALSRPRGGPRNVSAPREPPPARIAPAVEPRNEVASPVSDAGPAPKPAPKPAPRTPARSVGPSPGHLAEEREEAGPVEVVPRVDEPVDAEPVDDEPTDEEPTGDKPVLQEHVDSEAPAEEPVPNLSSVGEDDDEGGTLDERDDTDD